MGLCVRLRGRSAHPERCHRRRRAGIRLPRRIHLVRRIRQFFTLTSLGSPTRWRGTGWLLLGSVFPVGRSTAAGNDLVRHPAFHIARSRKLHDLPPQVMPGRQGATCRSACESLTFSRCGSTRTWQVVCIHIMATYESIVHYIFGHPPKNLGRLGSLYLVMRIHFLTCRRSASRGRLKSPRACAMCLAAAPKTCSALAQRSMLTAGGQRLPWLLIFLLQLCNTR